ncbi:MAG: 6-phosphogluconolactonase [Candidatus Nomurabacteria bacterium]
MDLNINITKNIEDISQFVADSINLNLENKKNVLWLVSGGSAVLLEVLIAKKVKNNNINRLSITLVDERYGQVDHIDSNWLKLKDAGFSVEGAKIIPFLSGEDIKKTVVDIKDILKDELDKADYKIGIFGIGIDGHTAGILPNTKAVTEDDLICAYDTEIYRRITITPRVIKSLDEAIVYSMGKSKWPIIEKLKKDISITEMPAQILKKVPKLTIFTDYSRINK